MANKNRTFGLIVLPYLLILSVVGILSVGVLFMDYIDDTKKDKIEIIFNGTNILATITTMILTVYIATYLNRTEEERMMQQQDSDDKRETEKVKNDKERHDSQLAIQKKIAQYQIKFDAYQNFANSINKFSQELIGLIPKRKPELSDVIPISLNYDAFLHGYLDLFPSVNNEESIDKINNQKKILFDIVTEAEKIKSKLEELEKKGIFTKENYFPVANRLNLLLEPFHHKNLEIIKSLQKDLHNTFN